MHSIIYTQGAIEDLEQIRVYIAEENPWYAQKVVDDIINFIHVRLSIHPQLGRDLGSKLRKIIEPNFKYTIVYKYDGKNILVYAIFKYKNIDIL